MTRCSALLAFGALALPSLAGGAESSAAPVSTTGGLVQAVVGLAIVLVLIWGAARVMRRLQPHMAGRPGPMRVVASQVVGQRERVVLLEIGEHWLVAGVAPGSVNALATLPKGIEPSPSSGSAAAGFNSLLAKMRGSDEHST